MRELVNDSFYELMKNYQRCIIDYRIIEDDISYQGYRSHKDAILFAMLKVIERYIDSQIKAEKMYLGEPGDEAFPWNMDIGKARAHQIGADTLLDAPKILREESRDKILYDYSFLKDGGIAYWYAFLKPPYGSGYRLNDFYKINSLLFPQGTDELEVYEWTTNWSNYFDAGHEWWGAACWSVYDKSMNRYVVIMASATD